jgi:hypothetical protein
MTIRGGMETLVRKLYKQLQPYVRLQYQVTSLESQKDHYVLVHTNKGSIKASSVVLATDYYGLASLYQLPIGLGVGSSIRVYIKFRTNFNVSPGTYISNTPLKWTTVISPRLIMAAYVDMDCATNLYQNGNSDKTIAMVQEFLKQVFPSISSWPLIKKHWIFYYPAATTFWLPRTNAQSTPILSRNILTATIPDVGRHGLDQQWINGVLETASLCLKYLI